MKERPILFRAPMVRAILDGRKTQTRRVIEGFDIKGPSRIGHYDWFKNGKWEGAHKSSMNFSESSAADNCPYGQVGDQLWVREKFQPIFADGIEHGDYVNYKTGEGYAVSYPATDGIIEFVNADDDISSACKPSIHMPRWASRIQLEITGIRVERLQDISKADAKAEGCDKSNTQAAKEIGWFENPRKAFLRLWESINGDGSWDANPWVWVIEFKRVERSA